MRISQVVCASVLLTSVAPLSAQDFGGERLRFDPAKGEWVVVAAPVPGTEDGDLELARALLARGEYKQARKAFKDWMKLYPDSPRYPEALFYAADTEIAAEDAKNRAGDIMQAYRWYQELLEGWPGTELADRAIRREMIIAEMFLFKGKKQKIWKGVLWLAATDEALTMLDRIIDEWAPNTPTAEQALRLKGDYHFGAGEFEEAEKAYARIVREHPRGRYLRFALLRCGGSALARFPGVEFDDADLLEAEVYFQDFQQKYPDYAAERQIPQTLERIRDSRAQKDYVTGEFYERTGKTRPAIFYYRLVTRQWSDTQWATLARNKLDKLVRPEEGAGEGLITGETTTAPSSAP
jgi:outer membrane protein assembly factor BamD (BamD/ComL family)